MAETRDAVDTITGYYYQFDYYILKLLKADDNDVVCIEGIEDVDITGENGTSAIQCKYYAKTEYNHSVIAKPIRLMLNDFAKRKEKKEFINYFLYGKYSSGQEKLENNFNVEFLKKHFLTYRKEKIKHKLFEELRLNDLDLELFLSKLHIDINAVSYEKQEKVILDMLQKIFNCNAFNAEFYYYNSALRLVKKLATQQDIQKRKITKREFLEKINTKLLLFDDWYLEYKGIKEYCRSVRKNYFIINNISPVERVFMVECDEIIRNIKIVSLLAIISRKWSRLSAREANPFCPYVYLHNITKSRLIEIKKGLINEGICLIDGFDYLGADFSSESLTKRATCHNGIKIKVINELQLLEETLGKMSGKKAIYQFYIDNVYFETDKCDIKYIPIKETSNIEFIV